MTILWTPGIIGLRTTFLQFILFYQRRPLSRNLIKRYRRKIFSICRFLKRRKQKQNKKCHKCKISSSDQALYTKHPVREKCPYSEFFWSVFSRIWTEYREIFHISSHLVRTRENTDQKNLRIRALHMQWPSAYSPSVTNSSFLSLSDKNAWSSENFTKSWPKLIHVNC